MTLVRSETASVNWVSSLNAGKQAILRLSAQDFGQARARFPSRYPPGLANGRWKLDEVDLIT